MFMSPSLAVGRPAALDEEADVVDQRGVADQRPAPAPQEEEERGDGEAGGEGEAKEAGSPVAHRSLLSCTSLTDAGPIRCGTGVAIGRGRVFPSVLRAGDAAGR